MTSFVPLAVIQVAIPKTNVLKNQPSLVNSGVIVTCVFEVNSGCEKLSCYIRKTAERRAHYTCRSPKEPRRRQKERSGRGPQEVRHWPVMAPLTTGNSNGP